MESTNELVTAAEARAEGLSLDGVADNRCITKQQFNDNLPSSSGDNILLYYPNATIPLSYCNMAITQNVPMNLIYFSNLVNEPIKLDIDFRNDGTSFQLSSGQTAVYAIPYTWDTGDEMYCAINKTGRTWRINGAVLTQSSTESAFSWASETVGSVLTITAPFDENAVMSITIVAIR